MHGSLKSMTCDRGGQGPKIFFEPGGQTVEYECNLGGQSRHIYNVMDGRMDDLQFYVLFYSISVISGLCLDNNERLCASELRLQLRRFRLEQGSNSVR